MKSLKKLFLIAIVLVVAMPNLFAMKLRKGVMGPLFSPKNIRFLLLSPEENEQTTKGMRKEKEKEANKHSGPLPLPLYNSKEIGVCRFNASVQCLLICPSFCSWLDKLNNPKNPVQMFFKNFREKSKEIDPSEVLVKSFLENPKCAETDQQIADIQELIISCSKISEQVQAYEETKTMAYGSIEAEHPYRSLAFPFDYHLLKLLFDNDDTKEDVDFQYFFYSWYDSKLNEVLNLRLRAQDSSSQYEFDLDEVKEVTHNPKHFEETIRCLVMSIFFIYIKKLDIFIVFPIVDISRCPNRLYRKHYQNLLLELKNCLNGTYGLSRGKTYHLSGIVFNYNRGIDKKLVKEGEFYRRELAKTDSPFRFDAFDESSHDHSFTHVVPSVKDQQGGWFFCDDFYRSSLGISAPLIKGIGNDDPSVLGYIQEEEGTILSFVFSATNSENK